MKNFLLRNWKPLVCIAIVGIIGGFFTGLFTYDGLPPEMEQMILDQGLNRTTVGIVTAVQTGMLYGLLLGIAGIFFAEKLGLWKNESQLTKKPLIASACVALIGGFSMIFFDLLLFSRFSTIIAESFAEKPSVEYIISSLTYGAVIEEVMLRLFGMSLIAFIIHKIFEKKNEKVSTWVLVVANIIAAILFAAGHLPATFTSIGNSPIILFRCFLLNGGVGLLFGYLYRKYGLRYAMLAHGGCHIVSKLIWILFL